MEDLVCVIELLIPGACPAMPTGPVSLIKGEQRAYIKSKGALPPHWGPDRRLTWECGRDDSVMICWRRGATKKQRDAAYRWLARYGLDNNGRPKAWDNPAPSHPEMPAMALAG